MSIKTFEDIIAWQKAKELNILIHNSFKDCRDFSFRDQIWRASVSVMNNIAEGYERNGNKEFRNFLFIAKGSCAEVRSMLTLAVEFGYIDKAQKRTMSDLALETSKMLSGLIKVLK